MGRLSYPCFDATKGLILMPRTLTEEQSVDLAKLMIMMKVPKEDRLEIITAIETPEEMLLFLDKLSAKNFEMTPREVHQALMDTILETTLLNSD